MMKKLLLAILLLPLLSACGDREPENLMSPCVGAKGSPCDRIPINQQNIKRS